MALSTPSTFYNGTNIDAGNFAGPQVFRAQDAPRYTLGFIVVVVTAIIAGIIVLVYRFVCAHENRRRDASGTTEAFEHAYEDDLTDKKVRQAAYCWGRSGY